LIRSVAQLHDCCIPSSFSSEPDLIEYVSFGVVIDDIAYPDGRIEEGVLGGGGPQTAWGMAAALADIHHTMTAEGRVGLAASVGAEINGGILEPLDAIGVDHTGLKPEWEATPRAWQMIDEAGKREHRWQVPPPQADAVRPRASLLTRKYRNAHGFHWGLHPENPGLELAHKLTKQGKIVSLETFRPPENPLSDKELRDLLTACTIFSPNLEEAVGITGEHRRAPMLACFRNCGAKIIALRLGANGAEIWDFRGGRIEAVMVPAFQTAVVDAVGAGNAFCGAFLASLSLGLKAAACHAVTAASYLVEQVGIPAMLPARFDYETRLGVVYADTVTTF
jgi:cytidine kinase